MRGSVSTVSIHSQLPCHFVDLAVLSGLWMLALAVPLASSAFSSTFSTLESAQQTFKAANSMPCRGHKDGKGAGRPPWVHGLVVER